jgi:GxxExxY protein
LNKRTETIIGKAIELHRELGPGLLESAYETCLMLEIIQSGLLVERQKPISVNYKGISIHCGYRIDLLVEDCIIIELKSVEKIIPLYKSQLLSYLRLYSLDLGLLINFNVDVLKNGISRIINNHNDSTALVRTTLAENGSPTSDTILRDICPRHYEEAGPDKTKDLGQSHRELF